MILLLAVIYHKVSGAKGSKSGSKATTNSNITSFVSSTIFWKTYINSLIPLSATKRSTKMNTKSSGVLPKLVFSVCSSLAENNSGSK
jgi:hypothetical protein